MSTLQNEPDARTALRTRVQAHLSVLSLLVVVGVASWWLWLAPAPSPTAERVAVGLGLGAAHYAVFVLSHTGTGPPSDRVRDALFGVGWALANLAAETAALGTLPLSGGTVTVVASLIVGAVVGVLVFGPTARRLFEASMERRPRRDRRLVEAEYDAFERAFEEPAEGAAVGGGGTQAASVDGGPREGDGP